MGTDHETSAWPLAGLRVLELPGLASAFTGKCLCDLGAEVTRLVPRAGDPLDAVAPSLAGTGGAKSAAAFLWNRGKRLQVGDIGPEAVLSLAREAGVILHELTGAQLAQAGLGGLRDLAAGGAVVAAITSFGADGPLAAWRGSDLVHFAMGGYLYMTGERDGRPIMPSAPLQSWMHGGMHAAAAVLAALRRRRRTGEGALVDQAIRDTGPWMLTNTYQHWDMLGVNLTRAGARRDMGVRQRVRTLFEARDGWVVWMFTTGHLGAPSLNRLVAWMAGEGFDVTPLAGLDWDTVDMFDADVALMHRIENVFAAFLCTRTKAELLAWSTANGLMLAPVATIAEVFADEHLTARGSWTAARHGEARLRLPGAPIRVQGVAWTPPSDPAGVAAGRVTNGWVPPGRHQGAATAPLAGVRVLDLGSTLAAPTAGRHLAALGADVIKVETATHPDTLRVSTPYLDGQPGIDRSGYFGAYNAGKRSITLNLRNAAAVAVLRRLVEQSDVLLENYAPGVMDRLGIGAATLQGWNSRLVVASHSLSGQWGPRSAQRGYGQVAGGLTGWYDLTGEPGGPPIGPYSAYTDFLSWPILLAGIIVALEVRDATGRAPAVDHAQVESSLHFLGPLLVDLQLSGRVATRRGNARDDAFPNDTYRCRGEDRWVALTVQTAAEWAGACAVLRLAPELANLATSEARRARAVEVDAAITAAAAAWDADELAVALQARGVPAGPVARAEDLFRDRQLVHRGLFVRRHHAHLGDHAVIMPSFRIEGLDLSPSTPAPLLGEHTYEVLTTIAGLSPDEVAALAVTDALT